MSGKTEHSDRELLELAAKAAGFEPVRWGDDFPGGLLLAGWQESWNPLADSGEALELAVKLEIPVSPYCGYVRANAYLLDFEGRDRMEVVRRAIVMAAASLATGA